MPYYSNGDLSLFMTSSTLSDIQKQSIARDILIGLEFLHRLNFVHCDIKPQNVYLDEDMKAVIGDFDVSREEIISSLRLTTTIAQPAATLQYMAPDTEGKTFSTKSDIYSFGLVLFDLHFPPTNGLFQRPNVLHVCQF
jgi:serine/threonine protein kinase